MKYARQRDVIVVDLCQLRDHRGIIAVMRDGVVRLGHADLREGALAQVARQHEGGDSRDVRLKRQRLQIEHQLGVLVERLGHADGSLRHVQDSTRRLLLGFLNPPLDLADVVEIVADPRAVARAEPVLADALRLLRDRVENAAVFLLARQPLGRAAAIAEQALEDDARIDFHRQRRAWAYCHAIEFM